MRLVDTHAHLDFPQFDADREKLLKELEKDEIGIINISTTLESVAEVDKLSRSYPLVWGAIGLHPTEIAGGVAMHLPTVITEWERLIKANDKIVAIGEIGLDYFHNREDSVVSAQKAALREFLIFAEQLNFPVIIHCREAYGDLLTILSDYKARGVIHCFSGTQEHADAFLKLGFYLSSTAIITYPKNEAIRQVFAKVPEDRLLIETDCPFLPPQKQRGQRNDPRTVKEIVQLLADLRETSVEEVERLTTENANALFQLEK